MVRRPNHKSKVYWSFDILEFWKKMSWNLLDNWVLHKLFNFPAQSLTTTSKRIRPQKHKSGPTYRIPNHKSKVYSSFDKKWAEICWNSKKKFRPKQFNLLTTSPFISIPNATRSYEECVQKSGSRWTNKHCNYINHPFHITNHVLCASYENGRSGQTIQRIKVYFAYIK